MENLIVENGIRRGESIRWNEWKLDLFPFALYTHLSSRFNE